MSDFAPQHKYPASTMQYLVAQYKIKRKLKMESIKLFFRGIWEVIVTVQTARAAEHLARCGRYQEVRELMLGEPCSK